MHSIYTKATNEKILKEISNKVCFLSFNEDFTKMKIKFENSTLNILEEVEEVAQDDYGVWVYTTNAQWRFDDYWIYETNE